MARAKNGAGDGAAADTETDTAQNVTVHVRAKQPLPRRCRIGQCFSAEGHSLTIPPAELAMLQADPWLVVELKARDGS